MPKVKISEFSSTPANNTDIDSINLAEGCAPSGINDAIRELMAQLKDFQTGAVGDSFNGPVGTTTAAAGAFTTLSASSTVTLSGGTANGVAYLNGSKVVTSGSALTFDGNNLGVGTASPQSDSTYGGLTINGSNGSILTMRAGGVNSGRIYTTGTDNLNIDGNGSSSTNIIFRLGTGSTEQMRLTSTGLGIGTSSPAFKLDVNGDAGITASESYLYFYSNYSIGNNSRVRMRAVGAGGGSGYGGDFRLSTRASNNSWNTDALVVDSSANVGIGTSSPATKLQVYGGALTVGNESTYAARFGNNSNKGVVIGYDTTNNVGHIGSINPATAWTDLVINANGGNLGLGVTPSAWNSVLKAVSVGRAGSNIYGQTSANLTGVTANAIFDSSDWKYVTTDNASRYQQNGGVHSWYNAPSGTAGNAITFTQAATLDASGHFMIGTTSTTGSASNDKIVAGGRFRTVSGSVSTSHNTATTLFTAPTSLGAYLVTVNVDADTTVYAATYIVNTQGGSSTVATQIFKGANISVSVSGYNIQATQTSGGSATIQYSAVRIF